MSILCGIIFQGIHLRQAYYFLVLNMVQGPKDYEIDKKVGFEIIEAHEIDDIGVSGIIEKTRRVVKDTPTYLSIDIDGS